MAAFSLVFVACLLPCGLETLKTQKIYQPYGPKMCEKAYQNQADVTAWDIDEVYLVCKLSISTSKDGYLDGKSSAQSTSHLIQTRITEHHHRASLQGFLMQTLESLFYVNLAMKKKKISMRFKSLHDSVFYYDRELRLLYISKYDGSIYHGVIRNMRVNFKKYRKMKVSTIITMVVDKRNNMVALIETFKIQKLKIKCFNTVTKKPQKTAEGGSSSRTIVLDMSLRLVYFLQRSKLCSMDYQGNHKKIYRKVKVHGKFYLDFHDEHICCVSPVKENFVRYKFKMTSDEIQVTKTHRKCLAVTLDTYTDFIQVGELIIAVPKRTLGLVVWREEKCYRKWKSLYASAVFLL